MNTTIILGTILFALYSLILYFNFRTFLRAENTRAKRTAAFKLAVRAVITIFFAYLIFARIGMIDGFLYWVGLFWLILVDMNMKVDSSE